jgi:hypothetical protein
VLERLEPADAAALGLDPNHITYTPLADLPAATEKARRDATGDRGLRGVGRERYAASLALPEESDRVGSPTSGARFGRGTGASGESGQTTAFTEPCGTLRVDARQCTMAAELKCHIA